MGIKLKLKLDGKHAEKFLSDANKSDQQTGKRGFVRAALERLAKRAS